MVVESNGLKKTIILNPMQPEAQNKINPPTQGVGLVSSNWRVRCTLLISTCLALS